MKLLAEADDLRTEVASSRRRGLKLVVLDGGSGLGRRLFTEAWVETPPPVLRPTWQSVASSRRRGLKLLRPELGAAPAGSPLHGGVD